MRDRRLIVDVGWSLALILGTGGYFVGVGVLGAARSLGCTEECQYGQDWAWIGLAVSWAVGALFVSCLGWSVGVFHPGGTAC
jgi:hypothetical protein